MKMRGLKYICMAFFILFTAFPAHEAAAAEKSTEMKVKLKNYLGNQTTVTIMATGDYQMPDGKDFIKSGEELTVKVESGKLAIYKLAKKIGTYDSFTVMPVNEASLLNVNNRPYPGSMEFMVEGGYIRPINHVHIEEYVKGVVPREMPALWHIEALKAQTIAARTYALRYQSTVIDDTVSYQVYGGADGHPHSNLAAEQTKGLVIKHDGKLIEALFSSSNGGMTELNSNVWTNGEPLDYLAIKVDPFDSKTRWSIELDKQQINLSDKDLSKPADWWTSVKEKDTTVVPNLKIWLQRNGYSKKDMKITDIPVLSVSDKTSGGRVTKGSIQLNFLVRDIVTDTGELVPQTLILTNVAASKIREMVGTDKMKSYLALDSKQANPDKIVLEGLGFGHGVGMSQYGARNRAEAGQTYQEIIGFYYPNTTIVREYSDGGAGPAAEPVVNKDTAAPKITNILTSGNYSTEKASISYNLNEAAVVTVQVADSKGKVVATPTKGKSLRKGDQSATWNFANVTNGTYTATITAIDGSNNKKSVSTKITVKKTTGNVTATVLNMREKTNTTSKIVGQLKKNQTVTILAQQGNWYKVKQGNKSGYVSKAYIKKS
ncbi:SpoIID/LytB domain-containing protein [Peribacillus sp. NPDC097224]|uniref:SpoIID/LytB domain-containing protein n=1 Tax=Peribacillus sp. NPDC097224 TaxID=3364399 RepID=UPI0037FACED8